MGTFVYRARRQEIRRAYAMECHVVRDRDFREIGGKVLDLSPNGMQVSVDDAVLPGDTCLVSFRATPLNLWFDTDAVVTRLLRGRRPGDPGGLALGLEFTSLDPVAKLILRGFLRHVPPPLPRRDLVIDYARTIGKILSLQEAA